MARMNSRQFILATILNSGGVFESATKLQKLAFLSIYENNLEAFTDFTWYHYGPFSRELQNTVQELSNDQLVVEEEITRTSFSGNEYTLKRISLTPEGNQVARRVIEEMDPRNKTALLESIDKYGHKALSNIIQYVYSAYSPEDL